MPSAAEIAQLNENFRSLGPIVTGSERAEIAAEMGVTRRTVDRWFTTATEQRNFVPSSLAGKDVEELTDAQLERYEIAQSLGEGLERVAARGGTERVFSERAGSLGTAIRDVNAYRAGTGDPYLVRQVTKITWRFDEEAGQWEGEYEYAHAITI